MDNSSRLLFSPFGGLQSINFSVAKTKKDGITMYENEMTSLSNMGVEKPNEVTTQDFLEYANAITTVTGKPSDEINARILMGICECVQEVTENDYLRRLFQNQYFPVEIAATNIVLKLLTKPAKKRTNVVGSFKDLFEIDDTDESKSTDDSISEFNFIQKTEFDDEEAEWVESGFPGLCWKAISQFVKLYPNSNFKQRKQALWMTVTLLTSLMLSRSSTYVIEKRETVLDILSIWRSKGTVCAQKRLNERFRAVEEPKLKPMTTTTHVFTTALNSLPRNMLTHVANEFSLTGHLVFRMSPACIEGKTYLAVWPEKHTWDVGDSFMPSFVGTTIQRWAFYRRNGKFDALDHDVGVYGSVLPIGVMATPEDVPLGIWDGDMSDGDDSSDGDYDSRDSDHD